MAKKTYNLWICEECDYIIEQNPKKPNVSVKICPECKLGQMKKHKHVTLDH